MTPLQAVSFLASVSPLREGVGKVVKDQIVNIFGFGEHMVSVTTIYFCFCMEEAAMANP